MRAIIGFKGYFITKKGQVYSKVAIGYIGELYLKRQQIDKFGRPKITLTDTEGFTKTKTVAHLVALAYVPNPHNYPLVLHLDNNKTNNYYKNLAWGTYQMNTDQMMKQGRHRNGYT